MIVATLCYLIYAILQYKFLHILFNNKDKVKHHSCLVYRGICSCGADYIGETIRNSEVRWNEHITGKSF